MSEEQPPEVKLEDVTQDNIDRALRAQRLANAIGQLCNMAQSLGAVGAVDVLGAIILILVRTYSALGIKKEDALRDLGASMDIWEEGLREGAVSNETAWIGKDTGSVN